MEETKKTNEGSVFRDIMSLIAIATVFCVLIFNNTKPQEITVSDENADQKVTVDREVVVNFKCTPDKFPHLLDVFMKRNQNINLENIDSSEEGEFKVTFAK